MRVKNVAQFVHNYIPITQLYILQRILLNMYLLNKYIVNKNQQNTISNSDPNSENIEWMFIKQSVKVWKGMKTNSKCEQKTKPWNISFYLCIEEVVVSFLFTIYYLSQDAMLCTNKNNHPFKYMYCTSCTLLEDDPWDSIDIIFQRVQLLTNT